MIVLRAGQQFLLLQRKNPPHVGKYLPIGGKVEPHERPLHAALRETQEETGLILSAEQLHFCGVLVETSPTNYNWVSFIYVADINYQPPPPCDEGTLAWIHFDDIPNVPTPPTDWQIYQNIMQDTPFVLDAWYDKDLNMLGMEEGMG